MKVTLYLPSGLQRMGDYFDAIKVIKETTAATKICRWSEAGIQYEDFLTDDDTIVAQIETTGYPLLNRGFQYINRTKKLARQVLEQN